MDTQTENQVRPENPTNSRILRAKQFVAQDNIFFSPKLGLFTIVDRNTSPTGAEQTERGAEQTERGAEQTKRGAEHDVEHMEWQPVMSVCSSARLPAS